MKGASTHHTVLTGLVEWGNTGAGRAAQNGNIGQVDSVQRGSTSVLWGILYRSESTIVTGDNGPAPASK